jgi:uncharacterized cupredoxin-like copper-binding protein
MFRTVVLIQAALLLAACGSSSSSADTTPTTAVTKPRPQVTIDAKDYRYTLPATIPSGWVDVTLHNSGTVGHQIAFARLGSVSFAEFESAASATDFEALADVQFAGGPNNADPGGSVTATVHLEPGTYGVAGFIPDAKDGKSHAAHGMIGRVEVAETPDSVEEAPTVDGGSISLSEFAFLPNASFSGTGTVEIKNVGAQVHEAVIVKEAAGATLEQVKDYFVEPAGPPPFTAAGGVVGLGPGETMYQTMALTPGKYVMLCFLPDPTRDNSPHAREGMVKEITIS